MATLAAERADWLQVIRSEYLEMPGLRLTLAQAQRLWGLERDVIDALLTSLVEADFLARNRDGTYARNEESLPSRFRPRLS